MTQSAPQLSRRQTVFLAIGLIALIVLTLVIAPSTGSLQQRGSTYGRSPDGYGAWYAYMQQRGTSIQRWQKPLGVLFYPDGQEAKKYQPKQGKSIQPKRPITLLRISNKLERFSPNFEWVKEGNVLILVGVESRVSKAPYSSTLPSPMGQIQIDTSRRHSLISPAQQDKEKIKQVERLNDRFGAIVWEDRVGKGKIIYATAPYLAANAYQDLGNFEFFAKLVEEAGHPIWVDEYLHGYKDPPTTTAAGKPETKDDLLSYLLKTPLSLLAIQAAVFLGVLVWGQNRRLGPPERLTSPAVDNSEAYIQALSGVLAKANSTEFVVDTVGKAEQLAIQRALGLGTAPLPVEHLAAAYTLQTGQPDTDLRAVLQPTNRDRLTESDLQQWIQNLLAVRKHLG